ncbi:hypothetical protein SAMN05660772_02348 [Pasteurella testudinis DSM 23072]|uniref:Uncharacterized protein n=1 Tax=Pasteurella testudinis DSM 23072 TaxID=1122938 RepID=A0A1W1UUG8_9PAST|nr:hypothetical protein SAMN05660772_02348 [Pasteurella testudinis DSM 23072]SUB51265.1 Uncharacterised protein [Pasteurella testudinis]
MNKIKYFWNYLFYFAWRLHCKIGFILIERPLMYLLESILKFMPMSKHNAATRYRSRREVLDDMETGFNIRFVFKYFLTLTWAIVVSVFSYIIVYLGITINNPHSLTVHFIVTILISHLINIKLLGWYNNGYITYFKDFKKRTNNTLGYFSIILFYFLTFSFCLFTLYFHTEFDFLR